MLIRSGLSSGSAVEITGVTSGEHLAWVLAHGATWECPWLAQRPFCWKGLSLESLSFHGQRIRAGVKGESGPGVGLCTVRGQGTSDGLCLCVPHRR